MLDLDLGCYANHLAWRRGRNLRASVHSRRQLVIALLAAHRLGRFLTEVLLCLITVVLAALTGDYYFLLGFLLLLLSQALLHLGRQLRIL